MKIPHNAPHTKEKNENSTQCTTFKGKETVFIYKGRPRVCRIDNINEDLTSLGLTPRRAMDKRPMTMKIIYSYPLPSIVCHLELIIHSFILKTCIVRLLEATQKHSQPSHE